MITYKIEGCDSTFKSKPENFEGDVIRWKRRNSLKHEAQVTILENDVPEPTTDWASLGNTGEQQTVSEDTATPKRSNKRKPVAETADLQSVPNDVDEPNLLDSDESITDWNDYPFSAD